MFSLPQMDAELPNLLPPAPPVPPELELDVVALAERLAVWAKRGVFFGTSSWKYPGWLGLIYRPSLYAYRGEFSEARFQDRCLAEYARIFPTVGMDATYYAFPSEKFLTGIAAQVPDHFRFSFKVTDEITAKRFPMLPRFAERRGQPNPNFLNADLCAEQFLRPLEAIREKVGLVMFEFSRFYAPDFKRGRDFVDALDRFLGQLPSGWRYGVEVRNKNLLHPDFFALLARHRVVSIFNAWSGAPPLDFQLAQAGCWTTDLGAARLLIRPGNDYEDSERRLTPFRELKEPFPEGRAHARELVFQARQRGVSPLYVYLGNKFEGSSPRSIERIVAEMEECI